MKVIFYFFIILVNFVFLNSSPLHDYVLSDHDLAIVNSKLVSEEQNELYTTYKLNITTQKWFDQSLTNNSIWQHELFINVPESLNPTKPIYFHIDSEDIDVYNEKVANVSAQCNCITVNLKQVPNGPMSFKNDPKPRASDALIAFTFGIYMNYQALFPNKTYNYVPLLVPMTKSVRRAFDLTEKFLNSKNINYTNKYIVSGISKRGWTAYLITAVDKRVVGCIPIVFDLVNLNKVLHHTYMSYGGNYPFSMYQYYKVGITAYADSLGYNDLARIVDPYYFFEYYRGKKFLLMTASNDEFMMIENLKFFLRDLRIQTNGHVYMRRLPNTGHYLLDQQDFIFYNINSFLELFSSPTENPFPVFKWKFSNNFNFGKIDISLSNLDSFESYKIKAYYANTINNSRIDFRDKRLSVSGTPEQQVIVWKSILLDSGSIESNSTELTQSFTRSRYRTNKRYLGFFMEVALKLKDQNKRFILSTEVNIIPEYLPSGDCYDTECLGKLV